MRAAGFGLACAVVVVALGSGCGLVGPDTACPRHGERPDGVTRADLTGTYRSAAGAITLTGDGTFRSTGLPTRSELELEPTADGAARHANGRWRLAPASGPDWPVGLSFEAISDRPERGFGSALMIGGTRRHPYLYTYLGDPDACHVLTFERSG